MADDPFKFKAVKLPKGGDLTLIEVLAHYNQWNEDNDIRRTRKNGWNDVTDAYWGKLPADWPYISKVVDPVLRTTIIEKNSRLMNAKLRGRLVPREGGDVLSARLNNALLDFQWDNANNGGTMLQKWSVCDQDTRLYASKFALVTWRYEKNNEGECIFNGNEFQPLDIRDCGMDTNCEHIRGAAWFQVREWKKLSNFEAISDTIQKPLYPGLAELKQKIAEGHSDRRDTAYENRVLTLKGLSDRVGEDKTFPIIEVVTEYRKDKWITFAPRYKVILREIENPYEHGKIPVVQLRYYAIQGDPIGESEVEPVLPLWRAIQATVCGYLDNMNIHMRPPVKILDGKARIETIIFGPEAQWIVDSIDAVTEHQTNGEAMRYFQTTYSALKSAFNTAMGDLSQGVGGVDPFNADKTATEIRQSAKQQNSRDEKNQTALAEALEDMMSMWLANNKQFLFTDPNKHEYVLRIVGSELFNYFHRAGLDEMEDSPEALQMISDVVTEQGGNMNDDDLLALMEAGKTPRYPIVENPTEKDPMKLQVKPKMRINDMGDGAEISLVPEDINGTYDYIADTKSMATGAGQELQMARQSAINTLTTNPTVLQLLQQEGVRPQIKELLVSNLEDLGLKDAERFFTTQTPGTASEGNRLTPALPVNGIPEDTFAGTQGIIDSGASQPQGIPQQGGFPAGGGTPTF